MGNFVSLRKFAHESLAKSLKPNLTDFNIEFNLGERYAKKLSEKLNSRYDIVDFNISNNNILTTMSCITSEGSLIVEKSSDSMTNKTIINLISIVEGEHFQNKIEFSSFADFNESIEEFLRDESSGQ